MVGAIVAFADSDTTLVLDNLSHACILDGTFLAAGTPTRAPEVRFFNHNSAKSLERVLKSKERKNALVLVEGVYSLDGDMGTLPEIVEVCERYDAVLRGRRRARLGHARQARARHARALRPRGARARC